MEGEPGTEAKVGIQTEMTNSKIKGIAYAILSALIYGFCAVLIKYLSAMGLSVAIIIFGRGVIGAALAVAINALRKKKIHVSKGNLGNVFLLGLIGMCVSMLCLYNAYNLIPVGTVTTIHYLYPAIICIVNALLFRERLPAVMWIAVAACLGGMALLADELSGGSVVGILLSLLSAISWSFYMIFLERSPVLKEDKISITFFICVLLAVFGILYGLATDTLGFETFWKGLPILTAVAFLNSVVAAVLVQKGIQNIGAGSASVLSVFEPIAGILFGALIMNEELGLRQLLGCAIILAAVTAVLISNLTPEKTE